MPTDTVVTAMESKPPVEPGTYRATVTDITDNPHGKFGPEFQFVFTLEDELKDDGSPIEQWGWCSQTMTPASKLWKWAMALGLDPTLGEKFKMSDLIGRECQVFIIHQQSPTGPKAKLSDVIAAKKTAGASPKPKASVTPTADTLEPCFVCAKPSTAYDAHGRGVCEKHASLDLDD